MLSRALTAVGVISTVSIIIFLAMRVVPGDPVTVLTAGASVSEETKQNLRELYHLNDPIFLQYYHWVVDALQGNLGLSLKRQAPTTGLITDSLSPSLLLILGGTLVSLIVSLPLAWIAAVREGSSIDRSIVGGSLIVLSIPVFTSSVLAILVFSFWLGWAPAVGRGSGGLVETLTHFLLPSLVLGLSLSAVQTQTLRASLIDVLSQDYVVGAELRGLKPQQIFFSHIMRTAMLPVVTLLGLTLGTLLVGTVLIDFVFGLGGVGSLLIDSVQSRDYPVVQGIVMLISVIFVTANFLVDVVAQRLDPRYQGGA